MYINIDIMNEFINGELRKVLYDDKIWRILVKMIF